MIYEYKCANNHVTVRKVAVGEYRASITCPTCGQPAPQVISGGLATIFRGDGWPDKERRKKKGGLK